MFLNTNLLSLSNSIVSGLLRLGSGFGHINLLCAISFLIHRMRVVVTAQSTGLLWALTEHHSLKDDANNGDRIWKGSQAVAVLSF